jgi:hypothetical protein
MHRTEKLADHRSAGRPGCVPAMRSPIGVEAPKVPERRREGKTQPIMTARSARMATRDSPSDRVCEESVPYRTNCSSRSSASAIATSRSERSERDAARSASSKSTSTASEPSSMKKSSTRMAASLSRDWT